MRACERGQGSKTLASCGAALISEKNLPTGSDSDRKKLGFSSLGICCALSWAFLINAAASGDLAMQLSWQASYLFLAAAAVGFGYVASTKPGFLDSAPAGYVFAAAGSLFSILLLVSYSSAAFSFAQLPATVLCSCTLGWMYLQWSLFYTRVELKTAIGCLFIANIVASLIKTVAHFSPMPLSCAIMVLLPVASVLTCRMSLMDVGAPSRAPMRFELQTLKGLWKVALAIVLLSTVTGLLVSNSFGNQSSAPADVFILGRVFEVVVSALVLGIIFGLKKSFNYAQLWRIVLVVLAADVLTQALLPQLTLARCVESSVWDLLVLFIWLTAVDTAKHSKPSGVIIIGVAWALYSASFAIGSLMANWISAVDNDCSVTTLLMFVLVIVGAFCLEVRDQDTKWIFAELSGEPVKAPEEHFNIDERCDEIGAERGLSRREVEVMKLLCKGRTKAYIAETLYLTENTVRTHTKHIYTKLDVHSKQELMTLVGV